MKIDEVFIYGFRNLKDIHYLSTEKINAFFGQNAQGKTNFLESLYVTLRGDSFRFYSSKNDWAPILKDSDESSQPRLGVRISYQSDSGPKHQVELKQDGKFIRHYLDEKKVTATELKIRHPIVIFSPDDHQLIRGEPEERRSFGENILSDGVPGFAEHLAEYARALKQRNSLLKQLRDDGWNPELKVSLQNWDYLLAREALKLRELRSETWPDYVNIFQRVIHELFHTSSVDISWKTLDDSKSVEEYVEKLGKTLDKDIATGWSHYGPHRDDIEILLGQVSARSSASQGQARVLAMALRWSHAEWIRERSYEEPLFLVDDFSSELDEKHRNVLLEKLFSTRGQVFLTGTNESYLEAKSFAKLSKVYIVNGKIS